MKREGAVRVTRSKVLRVTDGAEVVLGKAAAAKPTNASKNATGGKCRRPHHSPATPTKSRDKGKGAHKLRACDVALNHRLVSWRVVDGGRAGTGGGVPDYKGASASAVLAYLAGSGSAGSSWYEDDDDGALEAAPPANSGLYDLIVGCAPAGEEAADLARPTDIEDTDAIEEQEQDDEEEFFMVGITIALEFSDGEEDWIVVEEI